MNSGFQEGRRPRANAVASLANTGHVSPLGRRPGGGAVQHAHRNGVRPGPAPLSARQVMNANRWAAETKRTADQFLRDAQNVALQRSFAQQTAREEAEWSDRALQRQWEERPFAEYDPRKGNIYDAQVVDKAGFATGHYGHRFGELWVYIRARGQFNTLEYAVVNPQTGNLLVFTPESALEESKRLYLSEDAQVRGTMTATGIAGGYLEKGFLVLSASVVAAPLVVALSETAAGGVVISALRASGAKIAKQFTWNTFRQKVVTDLVVQGTAGTIKNGGNWQKTMGEVNYTASLVAWLLPGSGWGAAARNSVAKATFKTNVTVDEDWMPHLNVKLPQLNSMDGFAKYLTDIGTDMIATVAKAKLVAGATPAARWASQAMQRTGTQVGRWMAANRVTLGTFGTVATSVEVKMLKDKEKAKIVERVEHLSPPAKKSN